METIFVCKLNSLIAIKAPTVSHKFRNPRTQAGTGLSLRMANYPVIKQQQSVVIPNKYGEKLSGLFHDTGSKDIVVLCHGFRSSKGNETMTNLANSLEKEGISAFRFDFAGNGESEGEFSYGNYWRETEDLRSVIDHFSGQNRVASVILGHSKGGNVVLLYASKYHDLKAVVNLAGRYDLSRGIEKRLGKDFKEKIKQDGFIDVLNNSGEVSYRVTEQGLMERLSLDMNKHCPLVDQNCKILTIHGTADETIPVEDASEFAKIIPNHRLEIIEGADHKFSSHQSELASFVVNFIKATMQQTAATS